MAGLTFLSSSASFLLATVSRGENGWRESQAMFGDIVTVFSVDKVSKPELEGDVCPTAQALGIYAGPWRRSACVMATPPSQRQPFGVATYWSKATQKLSNIPR